MLIELAAFASDFVADTGAFFPVERQTGDALADPLHTFRLLLEQGVLTEEKYTVAKAKLLD